ncbi:MAG: T9SS type A sorting domain-containing protein [Bacteroidota bacterium]
MNRLFTIILAFACLQISAQEFNIHFSNPEVDNASSPSELCVELELSYTSTATLGFSNFLFDYDENVLANPRSVQSYLNSEYSVSTVTTTALDQPGKGDVADVRIVYDFANGVAETTLVGQNDCSITTGIARICFDVLNAGSTTNLEWIYDGDGSTTGTNVNTHISTLTNTSATQLDANSVTTGNCSLTNISIDIPNAPMSDGGVSCENFIIYNNVTVGAGTYKAANDIETIAGGSGVSIDAGATVVFDAANSITLRAGFTATNGVNFTAKIGGCVSATLSPDDMLAENRGADVITAEEMKIEVTPNPVYNQASIRFFSPAEEYVSVKIFDLNGRMVEHLHQQYAMKGWNQTYFYPKHLSSGIYFVTVQTKDTIKTKRLIVQSN